MGLALCICKELARSIVETETLVCEAHPPTIQMIMHGKNCQHCAMPQPNLLLSVESTSLLIVKLQEFSPKMMFDIFKNLDLDLEIDLTSSTTEES